jgi:hypothetical protein
MVANGRERVPPIAWKWSACRVYELRALAHVLHWHGLRIPGGRVSFTIEHRLGYRLYSRRTIPFEPIFPCGGIIDRLPNRQFDGEISWLILREKSC